MEQSHKSRMCKYSWLTTVTRPTCRKIESQGVEGRQPPHIQESTSSSSPMCTAIATILHSPHEVLFDSGSSISSINQDSVYRLSLATSKAPPIKVLFDDHQHLYQSNTTTVYTLKLGPTTITHTFYVLLHQLFPRHSHSNVIGSFKVGPN